MIPTTWSDELTLILIPHASTASFGSFEFAQFCTKPPAFPSLSSVKVFTGLRGCNDLLSVKRWSLGIEVDELSRREGTRENDIWKERLCWSGCGRGGEVSATDAG